MNSELFAKLVESVKESRKLDELEAAGLSLSESVEVLSAAGLKFRIRLAPDKDGE